MSGIFDRRAKRFISTEQAERAVPSRTVMASRVARDDVNRSERVQKKEDNIQMDKDAFLLTQIDEFREKAKRLQEMLNTKESKAEVLPFVRNISLWGICGITLVKKQLIIFFHWMMKDLMQFYVPMIIWQFLYVKNCAIEDSVYRRILL